MGVRGDLITELDVPAEISAYPGLTHSQRFSATASVALHVSVLLHDCLSEARERAARIAAIFNAIEPPV
jgi:hypothetical protein